MTLGFVLFSSVRFRVYVVFLLIILKACSLCVLACFTSSWFPCFAYPAFMSMYLSLCS